MRELNIRPLEWEKYPAEGRMVEGQNYGREYVARAMLPWAAIFLMKDATGYSLKGLIDTQLSFPDEDAAKAAAQADFEARIRSALIPPSRAEPVTEFAKAILHGDDEHRAWLTEAATAFIAGEPLPPPRGKGTGLVPQAVAPTEEIGELIKLLNATYTAWNNPSDGLPEGAGVVLEAVAALTALSAKLAEMTLERDELQALIDDATADAKERDFLS